MAAARESLVPPPGLMPDAVVVAAQGDQLVGMSPATVRMANPMIEVTLRSRHATSREDARHIARFDGPPLRSAGAPACGARDDGSTRRRIGHGEPPLRVPLLPGDVAGDVGDHRSVTGQLAGGFGQSCKGIEVDSEVDHAARLRSARFT